MVERFHRQLKQSLKASESGKSWLEHLTWALLGLRAAHTKDATVTSVEVVFGSQMILPHQARTREVVGGVPQITLRQWSYVEVAGGRPSLLDGATHVYVQRGAVGGPLENFYSIPYNLMKHKKKILLLKLGSRQEWVSADWLKPHTGASPVAV